MPRPFRRAPAGSGALVELTRELGRLLTELGLTELEVAWGRTRVRLQRAISAPEAISPAAPGPVAEVAPTSLVTLEAPMVGTFYRASAPGTEPYVREGDVVKEGQIVCIIEAMKLMNEIECKVGGRVAKVLVENGHAVEYGQGLFLIDPLG